MKKIPGITDDAKQQFNAVIEQYDNATIYLEYKPQQYGWFMNITWGSFSTSNIRVTNYPNILSQFKNVLPFGICITSLNGVDPVNQDDWLANNSFYILEGSEVQEFEAITGG